MTLSKGLIYMTTQQVCKEKIKITQIKGKHVQEGFIASLLKVVSNWKIYKFINLEYIHECGIYMRQNITQP